MDALSDVLRVMRLKGGVYLYGEFHAPWCILSETRAETCSPWLGETAHVIPYHYILEGTMRVRAPDGTEFDMGPGESVLFPRNDIHYLGSDLGLPPVRGDEVVRFSDDGKLATIHLGEGTAPTRIVCGFLGTEDVRGNPVIGALPAALHLDVEDGSAADWVQTTFRYAADQIAAGRMGSETVMGKLSELLFIDAIRRYAESIPNDQKGWLAGLKDRYVARALALMHARVAHPWTVDELGREIGLSRSALAARFGEVLGMPPMQYLARWRIHVAGHELVNSAKSIQQVALEVGYDSEASFTRAFRRIMDAPPGAWRKRQDGSPELDTRAER